MSRREQENLRQALRGIKRNRHPILPADEIIKLALETHGDQVTLGWSGGRCSTVVLHMALKQNPDIRAIYVNTGIEFPENVAYVREVADIWGVNLTELKPDKTFWQIVENYGFPKFRRIASRTKKGSGTRPACCYYLKEKPRFAYYKEHDIVGDISGLRAAESRVRAIVIGQKGIFYTVKKPAGLSCYHPIALWETDQVLTYIKKHGIPHNPVYDTQKRNGCLPCTAYTGWEKNILKYNPKMYRFVQHKRGVMLMDDYIPNLVPCEEV